MAADRHELIHHRLATTTTSPVSSASAIHGVSVTLDGCHARSKTPCPASLTERQDHTRSLFYLLALVAIVWSLRSIEIIPEFLYDAPQQTVDLFARMWPIDWAWYPKVVHDALIETLGDSDRCERLGREAHRAITAASRWEDVVQRMDAGLRSAAGRD